MIFHKPFSMRSFWWGLLNVLSDFIYMHFQPCIYVFSNKYNACVYADRWYIFRCRYTHINMEIDEDTDSTVRHYFNDPDKGKKQIWGKWDLRKCRFARVSFKPLVCNVGTRAEFWIICSHEVCFHDLFQARTVRIYLN